MRHMAESLEVIREMCAARNLPMPAQDNFIGAAFVARNASWIGIEQKLRCEDGIERVFRVSYSTTLHALGVGDYIDVRDDWGQ